MKTTQPHSVLSCIHTSLQPSCVIDVSITYLPQLNTTYSTCSLLCSVAQCRDGNTTNAIHHNADTVKYKQIFSDLHLLTHMCDHNHLTLLFGSNLSKHYMYQVRAAIYNYIYHLGDMNTLTLLVHNHLTTI